MVRTEQEVFDDLAKLCVSPGYIHALAFICYRDNVVGCGDELRAEDLLKMHSNSRLLRTEVSTLIGLMVKKPIDFALPAPAAIDEYITKTEQLLQELHDIMTATMMAGFDPSRLADPGYNPMTHGDALREAIFYGAESAYTFQYRDLAGQRYRADAAWMEAHKGFTVDDATAVTRALSAFLNDRLLSVLKALRGKPPAEWTMLPAFCFTAAELEQSAGVNLKKAQLVLDALCLPNGSSNAQFNALQDYNETNAFPILRNGENEYVLLQYYSLTEAIYESPYFWMLGDKKYRPTASENRGNFTEDFAAECMRRSFGADAVYMNVDVFRTNGTKLGEIDVLILFGGRAIVLQAKSKRLTLEARKGNDLRLQDDFKKAIQESYDQAFDCAEALLHLELTFKDGADKTVSIPAGLKRIFPVCIVADHYPALAFQAREFLNSKTTATIAPPLVTDVFALDAMSEMLGTPLHFLNYIDLRARFGDSLLASHEFTLLSYHLKQNLWVDNEFNMMMLNDDISVDLDVAMATRRDGIAGIRTPKGILTRDYGPELNAILTGVERRSDPATTDFALFAMQINDLGIKQLCEGIAGIKQRAAKYNVLSDMTLLFSGAAAGLTVHCHPWLDPTAMHRLRDHCERRKYAQRASRWFDLGLSASDAGICLGVSLDSAWVQDPQLDELVKHMPEGQSLSGASVGKLLKRKIGRNDPCPCGSKRKHKKCCGR